MPRRAVCSPQNEEESINSPSPRKNYFQKKSPPLTPDPKGFWDHLKKRVERSIRVPCTKRPGGSRLSGPEQPLKHHNPGTNKRPPPNKPQNKTPPCQNSRSNHTRPESPARNASVSLRLSCISATNRAHPSCIRSNPSASEIIPRASDFNRSKSPPANRPNPNRSKIPSGFTSSESNAVLPSPA